MALNKRVWVRIKGSEPVRWKRGWQRIAYPTATHYSPNFTRKELNCRGPECVGKQPPAAIQKSLGKLARDLEQLRVELGGKVGILGGYRCPAHNKRVHGASQSQHLQGTAADLAVPSGYQKVYEAAALMVPAFKAGGIGTYENGGVHVDRRGWVARWNNWIRS